jgi:hypothetical protein
MWEEYRVAMQSSRAGEWRLYPREGMEGGAGGVAPDVSEAVDRLMAFGVTEDRGLVERALRAAGGNSHGR